MAAERDGRPADRGHRGGDAPSTLRRYATAAGFSRMDVLAIKTGPVRVLPVEPLASPLGLGPARGHTRAPARQPARIKRAPAARSQDSSGPRNRRSVGGQPFVSVGLDRSVPRQIVAVGVDQIDVSPDHRPELVGGELSVGEPHAVGVGRVRGRAKGSLTRLATSELLEEVHSLCGELGRPNSLVPLTREHHLLASLAP
jgi:hypothetical protein